MRILHWFGCLLLFCGSLLAVTDGNPDSRQIHARPPRRWSQFPCPEEDDVTAVIDNGWDLDRTFFNYDGDIVIYLDIRRYLGTKEEMFNQQCLGLLPQTARLYIPAYDVDIHGCNEGDIHPEQDEVYFNGRKIGSLTGDDEIWHLHEFSVPFHEVKFPDAPGGFKRNEIRIRVDVRNTDPIWCTQIDWVALTFHAPRPVLMVHGLNSDGSTWNKMQKTLSDELGIPSEVLDVNGQGAISSNAAMIRSFLNSSCHYGNEGLKQYYNVREFNILAHSKGGLDSRYYVSSRGLNAHDIKNVMQIATPNGGCDLAEKFYNRDEDKWQVRSIYSTIGLIGHKANDATFDLRPKVMRQFNRSHPLKAAQANVSVLAGCIPPESTDLGKIDKFRLKIFNFMGNVSYRRDIKNASWKNQHITGDGIVSVASAHILKNATGGSPLCSSFANHVDIISKMAMQCIQMFSGRLCQIVYPKYQGGKTEKRTRCQRSFSSVNTRAGSPEEQWSQSQVPGSGREIMETLYLEPGKQTEFSFMLRQKQNLEMILMRAGRKTIVELILPSGKIMTPKTHPENFHYADELNEDGKTPDFFLGLSGNFLYLGLSDAEKGKYRLKLDGKALDQLEEYHFMTRDLGPSPALEARLKKNELTDNENFIIEARMLNIDSSVMKDSGYDLSVRCREQRKFDDEGIRVSLNDNGEGEDQIAGDGIHTAVIRVKEGTLFDFFVKAEKNTQEEKDSHMLSLTGSRIRKTARILQGFREDHTDSNGNGFYDFLRISGQIEVSEAGIFWLDAALTSQAGSLIQEQSVKIECPSPGIYDFFLKFSGEEIFNSKEDGPYTVGNLTLARDEEGVLLNQEKVSWNYHTEGKKHIQYEHSPLLFLQTGCERNLDHDGDGKIDQIEISVNLLIADQYQGDYIWSTNLLAEDGAVVANAYNRGSLEKATDPLKPAVITFRFSCDKIAERQYRGPFKIQMITMDNRSAGQVRALPCNYKTRFYSPFEFIKEPGITDVTDMLKMNFTPLKPNRMTGTVSSEITLTNCSPAAGKPMNLIFRLTLPSSPDVRLCRIDGRTDTGMEYMDITAEIERQLLLTGNHDYRFDKDEQVKINIPFFSKNHKLPEPRIYSHMTESSPEESQKPVLPEQFFLDENQDMKIDDWEMLRGMNLWYNLRLNDSELFRLIRIWQAGQYIRNEEQGVFEPIPKNNAL